MIWLWVMLGIRDIMYAAICSIASPASATPLATLPPNHGNMGQQQQRVLAWNFPLSFSFIFPSTIIEWNRIEYT